MAMADAAAGGASIVDLIIGSGIVIVIGEAAARALPGTTDATTIESLALLPEDDDDDDSDDGLRWGVASVVSLLPLFGFLSFLLPALAEEPEEPDADAAATKNRYLSLSGLFFVAFASKAFDPTDAATWGVAAACAATLQLERVARDVERAKRSRERAAAAAAAAAAAKAPRRRKKRAPSAPKTRAVFDAVRGGTRGRGEEGNEGNEGGADANARGWGGGAESLPGGFGGVVKNLRVPALPEVKAPTVRDVGRTLGAAQIAAVKLRGEVEEGKIRARIEFEEMEEAERLEAEAELQASEREKWDARFEVRSATIDGLKEIARERGLRGYSKLRRAELLKLVEEELWGDEPFSVGGVEYVDEPEPEPEPEGKNPFKFW